MASTLAQQLKQIRTVDKTALGEKGQLIKPTFLFTSGKEAAQHDDDTIYSLGVNGLEQLISLDPRFAAFEETLFASPAKELDRTTLTVAENEKLDASIREFLVLVSPRFTTQAAAKALEWLVRRFRIQEFNIDHVVAMILPYHETRAFAAMLGILRIRDGDRWAFMFGARKERTGISRADMVRQCVRDRSLVAFILETVVGGAIKGGALSRVHVGFVTATLAQYIEALPQIDSQTVKDLIAGLIPYLASGSKGGNESGKDIQLSAYMLLALAFSRTVLHTDLLGELLGLGLLNKAADERSALLFVCQLFKSQQVSLESASRLPASFWEDLVQQGSVLTQHLSGLAKSFDIRAFVDVVVPHLASTIGSSSDAIDCLSSIVSHVPLSQDCATKTARHLLHILLSTGASDKVKDLLRALHGRYPEQLQQVMTVLIAEKSDDKAALKALFEAAVYAHMGLRMLPVGQSGTPLYLGLHHADAQVRHLALAQLLAELDTRKTGTRDAELDADTAFAADAFMSALSDMANSKTALLALQSPHLARYVPPAQLVALLSQIIFTQYASSTASKRAHELLSGELTSKALESSERDDLIAAISAATLVFVAGNVKSVNAEVFEGSLYSHNKSPFAQFGVKFRSNKPPSSVDEIMQLAARSLINHAAIASKILALLTESEHAHVYSVGISFGARLVTALASTNKPVPVVMDQAGALFESMQWPVAGGAQSLPPVTELIKHSPFDIQASSALTPDAVRASAIARAIKALLTDLKCHRVGHDANAWLQPKAQWSLYELLVAGVFEIVASIPSYSRVDPSAMLLSNLVRNNLPGDEFITFALHYWMNPGSEASVATVSTTFLLAAARWQAHTTGQDIDFQVALPYLLMHLAHSSEQVRASALSALAALGSLYKRSGVNGKASQKGITGDLFLSSALFGSGVSTEGLQFLPSATAALLVSQLVSQAAEIRVHADHVCSWMGSALSWRANASKRERTFSEGVLACLLSHAASAPSFDARRQILALVRTVESPQKLLSMAPLLSTLLATVKKSSDASARVAPLIADILTLFRASSFAMFASTGISADTEASVWKHLLELLSTPVISDSVAQLALSQLNQSLFETAPSAIASALYDAVIALAQVDSEVAISAQKVLGRIQVSTAVIAGKLASLVSAFQQATNTGSTAPATKTKSKKLAASVKVTAETATAALEPLTMFLEQLLRGQASSSEASDVTLILSPLFDYLSASLAASTAGVPVSLDYTTQLALQLATGLIDQLLASGSGVAAAAATTIPETAVRIDVVVQLVRSSSDPNTINHALLLLAAAASLFPDRVLHNVMAVFMFMSATTLRQDDKFSFHVIDRVIGRILPPLVRSATGSGVADVSACLQVLGIFVDALAHIPQHRRLDLFRSLVSTMGAAEFLTPTCAIIIERHVVGSTDSASSSAIEFATALCAEFDANMVLHTLLNATRLLAASSVDQPPVITTASSTLAESLTEHKLTQAHTSATAHSSKSLIGYRQAMLDFIRQVIGDAVLVPKLYAAGSQLSAETVELTLSGAVESLLLVVADISASIKKAEASGKASSGKASSAGNQTAQALWEVLVAGYDAVDAITDLLADKAFASMICRLLQHPSSTIRRRAMASLVRKITNADESAEPQLLQAAAAYLRTIPYLLRIADQTKGARHSNEAKTELTAYSEPTANRQVALHCVAALATRYASNHQNAFANVMPVILSNEVLGSSIDSVAASAIACIAVLCQTLGARMLSNLPKFMPVIMDRLDSTISALETQSSQDGAATLVESALSGIVAIITALPTFLTPYLPRILALVTRCDAFQSASKLTSSASSQLAATIASTQHAIIASVAPRHLLPPLMAHFSTLLEPLKADNAGKKQAVHSVATYFALVANVMSESLTRTTVAPFCAQIFKFFLVALDTRRLYSSYLDSVSIDTIESAVVKAYVAFVLKLSENIFRPLHLKAVQWSVQSLSIIATQQTAPSAGTIAQKTEELAGGIGCVDRLVAFYRAWSAVLSALKSVAAPFVSSTLDNTVSILKLYAGSSDGSTPTRIPDTLWSLVMEALNLSLQHDDGGYWTTDAFEKTFRPLADQLLNTSERSSAADLSYLARAKSHIIPCLVQLAVTLGGDSRWKPLNHHILLHTRSENVQVRLAALQCVQEFYGRLGDDFLFLLPETVPFLAELMEDADPRVEKLAHQTIAVIEEHLGESIKSYFN
ncbi:ARM repeat-containing protein [Ramicandelaber brevisporus]|nr:ARM repeat-containing protein [Ramicandelaber brevisporus]